MFSAVLYISDQLITRLMFRSSLWLGLWLFFISSVFSVKSLTKTHSRRNEGLRITEGPVTLRLCLTSKATVLERVWTSLNSLLFPDGIPTHVATQQVVTQEPLQKQISLPFRHLTRYVVNHILPFISISYSSSTAQLFILIIITTKNWCRSTTYIPIPHAPAHHKTKGNLISHNNDTKWWSFVFITRTFHGFVHWFLEEIMQKPNARKHKML